MGDTTRQRWPFLAISVVGLAIGLWGAPGLLSLSAAPPGYPVNPILYPAHVGAAVVGSKDDLRFIAESRPPGSILEIRSDAGTAHVRLAPLLTRLHFAVIVLEGLAFLALSFFVFAPRAERGPIRDLYWCALLYGIATMIHGLHFPRSRSLADWLLPAIWIACVTTVPVLFFRVSQTFPRPRPFLDRRPQLMRALWIAAAALAVWQITAAFVYFVHPTPGVWGWLALPRTIAEMAMVLGVGLGCLTLYRSGRRLELAREREQTRWILWGITIGAAPYVLFRALPNLAGFRSSIPPEVDRMFELCIPVAFAFAVVPYRRVHADIIIRGSLIYGALTALLVTLYLLVGVVLGRWIADRAPYYSGWIQFLAVALPVVLYAPGRRWLGAFVDRLFFKVQYDYAQALPALQDAMRTASSQEEIAEWVRGFVGNELELDSAAVMARRGALIVRVPDGESEEDSLALLEAVELNLATRRLLAAPNSTTRPDLESPAYPAALSGAGFLLALPLTVGERVAGAILIGEKTSRRRFIEEDLRLLHAVRAEAAAALERVESVQRASEDLLLREREGNLERLKSEFYSRVAHDLRTPLASIRANLHSQEPQKVEAAATQLGRLVHELSDLSRMEQPDAPFEDARVDLLPLVQEALHAVEAAARGRSIRFDVSVAPSVRPVRGDRAKLLEIVTNLLENAARYSPDGEAVDITVAPNGEGQMLSVRDRGPGIPVSDRERIFQRFEQGRSSPFSKDPGFGLGLYVARSYLERMRGTIQAENHPDGGARFVCTVPEWNEAVLR